MPVRYPAEKTYSGKKRIITPLIVTTGVLIPNKQYIAKLFMQFLR